MEKQTPIVALIYDFDRTLCDQDMQNYSFIPALGKTPKEFWNQVGEFAEKENMEGILAYLYVMVKEAKKQGLKLSKEYLQSLGKDVNLYPGVKSWFDRINKFGKDNGVIIEHYIISSGIKDIIEGSEIAKHFKAIFGCDFYYENNEVVWPKIAINFTLKTQYIYKINKGIFDEVDDTEVNKKTPIKRIPFKNMIYIGDGVTDIPCMIMLKKQGGKSIGLYANENKEKVLQFLHDDRINYTCNANYTDNSRLDRIVKLIISSIALNTKLDVEEEKEKEKI